MASIILRVHIDTGGSDIRVAQVVTYGLQIHVVALVSPRRMAHPVGGGLLYMRGSGLMIRTQSAQAGCGFTEDCLDQLMHRTASHRFRPTNQWQEQWGVIALTR